MAAAWGPRGRCSVVVLLTDDHGSPDSCLKALLSDAEGTAREALVVDNRAEPSTVPFPEVDGRRARRIRPPSVLSPAAACNLGAGLATGRFVAFLDGDTVPVPGWAEELIAALEDDPDAGAAGSRILDADGTIEHAGIAFGPYALPYRNHPYRPYRTVDADAVHVNRPRAVPAVCRAGLLLRRDLFLQIGGFDAAYTRAMEDVDLCLRLRGRGLRILYRPRSVLRRGRGPAPDAMDAYGADLRRLETRWAPRLAADDDLLCRQDGEEATLERSRNAAVARRRPAKPAPLLPQVVWTAGLFNCAGYAEEARNAVLALDRAGGDVLANALHWPEPVPGFPPAVAERLRRLATADLRDPFIHVMHADGGGFRRSPRAVRNVGRTLYEADGLPRQWVDRCNEMDEVWVAGEFHLATFARAGVEPSKLRTVPHAIDTDLYDPAVRPLPLPGASGFVFLSVWQWLRRKGWDVLLRAWFEEFGPRDDVTLVLKISRTGFTVPQLRERLMAFVREDLRCDPDRGPRVVLLDRTLDAQEMPRLYRAADAYVMPSRGEGWGRPYLEAMAMGLPTIGTGWSGNLEFMDDANSYLVDCSLEDIPEAAIREERGFEGLRWAEPSVEHLRRLMRRVYDDRDEARAKGAHARRDVVERFGLRPVGVLMLERLRAAAEAAEGAAGAGVAGRVPMAQQAETRSTRRPGGPAPESYPLPPVVWSGPLLDGSGLAEEGRAAVMALDRARVPLRVQPFPVSKLPFDFPRAVTERLLELGSLDVLEPFVHVMHGPAASFRRVRWALANIGRTLYETDGLPPRLVAACNEMDEVWVPGRFNLETFTQGGVDPDRLHVVPEAIDTTRWSPSVRPLPLPAARGFVFLSVISWGLRKGWDVLLRAYYTEFRRRDDVTLVLKVDPEPGRSVGDAVAELRAFVRDRLGADPDRGPRLVVLTASLATEDMPRLYRAADAYVMPSRGEGWGRPFMEAMAMNLPTIGTRWGGNLEFMDEATAYLVDCSMVTVPEVAWAEPSLLGHRWAEPSVEHLRVLMRRVLDHGEQAAAKAERARRVVAERFSLESVGARMLQRIVAAAEAGRTRRRGRGIAVTWEGDQFRHSSLAVVNRNLCRRLAESPAIDLRLRADRLPGSASVEDAALVALAARDARPGGAPLASRGVHVGHGWPPDLRPPPEGHWVVILPWEYGTIPGQWVGPLDELVDEVWVPSTFVRNGLVRSGVSPERVVVVPNGVDPGRFHPMAAPAHLPTRKSFRFLFVGGTLRRKGADILIDTYLRTFGPRDDVCLVVKDLGTETFYRGQGLGDRIRAARDDPECAEILYVTDEVPHEALPGIYAACHALVQPYRAEAFCLPVAEAMACGLPVVVPAHGPSLDLCDPSVARLVAARETPLGDEWLEALRTVERPRAAEVDRDELAGAMRWAMEERDEARAMGVRASARVLCDLPWPRVARIVEDRLREITARPVRRYGRAETHTSPVGRWRYPVISSAPAPATAGATKRRKELSVCVVARDEEARLGRCLESVQSLADEIVVVDTGSTDRTVEIARSLGAAVVHRPWVDDFALVRNAYLEHASKEWILVLDADNTLDRASVSEVRRLIEGTDELVGFAPRQLSPIGAEREVVLEHLDVRLFPRHPDLRYVGRIHSQLLPRRSDLPWRVAPCEVVIHHEGYRRAAAEARPARERYVRVIEEEVAAEPEEPFHRYNLGVAYHLVGREAEAERELGLATELSVPHLARGSVPVFLAHAHLVRALALIALGRFPEAAAAAGAALELAPGYADPHCALGVAAAGMGRYQDALESYRRALAHAGERSVFPTDRSVGEWKALLGMGAIYVRQRRWTEAFQCLGRAVAAAPMNPGVLLAIAQLWVQLGRSDQAEPLLVQAARSPAASPEVGLLLARLREAPASSKAAAPRRASPAGASWPDGSVVFFCGEAWREWGPDSLREGCLGSEEAVIHLTARLARRGLAVTVFNNCPAETDREGVSWRRWERFDHSDRFWSVVSWRRNLFASRPVRAGAKVIDLHDSVPEASLGWIEDELLCVRSPYHRSLYPGVPDHRVRVIANGIDSSLFARSDVPRRRNLMVWTSGPQLGLDRLLLLWPRICAEVPDAELEVYYGLDLHERTTWSPEDAAYRDRVRELLEQPGVSYRGLVSQFEVAEAYLRADVLPYLAAAPETDCISVAKAQAAGCIPVTTDPGALRTKNRFGLLVPGTAGRTDTDERFLATLVDLLCDEEWKRRIRNGMHGDEWDWDRIAERWLEVLTPRVPV